MRQANRSREDGAMSASANESQPLRPRLPLECILRVICSLLAVALALAAGRAAEAAPALSLNQTSLKAGDTLRVGLTAQNAGSPLRADFYLGILLSDGVTVFFVTSLAPVAGLGTRLDANPNTFQPLLANISLPQGMDVSLTEIFAFTFAGKEPAGTYVVFAALPCQAA